LVDALRRSGFMVTEAWPLDTEKPGRLVSQDASALASSIFLVAQKRSKQSKGTYEETVQSELHDIVRERVTALWDIGISGADLVISCVGAGLRAFTRYAEVEYSNGEEVPAERFLSEVETAVLEAILGRLSKEVGGNGGRSGLANVDAATRFYTLWRYTYKASELDSGEAIIFANGTHVELDGLHGLSSGSRPLVEKKKAKYRLLDYADRGDDTKLGLPSEDGNPAPLVDVLHRVLWLMECHPSVIPGFLNEARPNTEQMRLVAQALAGPALKGGELGEVASGGELAALTKLTANWRSVIEDAAGAAAGPLFKTTR
jgi:putative DNA methylase